MSPDGSRDSWHADIAFIHAVSGQHYFVDVTVVNFDADSYLARCRRPGDVERLLVAEEQAKRNQPIVRRILNERGNSKIFVPFVMSSAGGFGPEARKFLKGLYRDARELGAYYLGVSHPVLQTTWSTVFVVGQCVRVPPVLELPLYTSPTSNANARGAPLSLDYLS